MKLMTGIEITSIMVVDVLNEMIEVLEKLSTSKISFSTEIELISIFQMIFTESLFESEVFCVIATIIYRSIKETALLWSHIQYLFFIHIYLLQFGIYFVTSKGLRFASNDIEDYPLHKAVYESSTSDLIELLYNSSNGNFFYLGLEDCDPLGNTPLTLAVKIKNIEAIIILIDYWADPCNQPTHRGNIII